MAAPDREPTREARAELWRDRLGRIDWTSFDTAYGSADATPGQLLDVLSPDRATALQATHELWSSLCHQHAYISSAAEPALPFLLEALELGDDRLNVELLDILVGFAELSAPPAVAGPCEGDAAWAAVLREQLHDQRERFEQLRRSGDETIAAFASRVLAAL